jgi:hypothetical protein
MHLSTMQFSHFLPLFLSLFLSLSLSLSLSRSLSPSLSLIQRSELNPRRGGIVKRSWTGTVRVRKRDDDDDTAAPTKGC